MIDFGIGTGTSLNSATAVEEAVRSAIRNKLHRDKIDLAVIFSSLELSSPIIAKTLGLLLPGIPIIGSNSELVFSASSTGEGGLLKHGIVLLLASFSEGVYCNTACIKDISSRPASVVGEELVEKLLYGFKNIPRNLGLLFFDRGIRDESHFLMGVQDHLGRSFPCFGASASDSQHPSARALFFNQSTVSDGCAGILWGGRMGFGIGSQHGWKPLGKPHTVTIASGNLIKTIDNRPAVLLYEDYLGRDRSSLLKEIQHFSVFYPIGVFTESRHEYLLRTVTRIEDDGSLICEGTVPEGSTIRLMISTKETCFNATYQAAQEAVAGLANSVIKFSKEKTSKLAIAFISISRYNLLRRDAKKELNFRSSGRSSELRSPSSGCTRSGNSLRWKLQATGGRRIFSTRQSPWSLSKPRA